MTDIPLNDAMLCWNTGGDACYVRHPDYRDRSSHYNKSVGACFSNWRDFDGTKQRLQFMIDAWHAVTFHGIDPKQMHEAMLVIPEYRDMLADDCLPEQFRHERD